MRLERMLVSLKRAPCKPHTTRAVTVPWGVGRDAVGRLRAVTNVSNRRLRGVRLMCAGEGLFSQSLPVSLDPGETLRVLYQQTEEMRDDGVLVLRWFEPDGGEMLWSVPLC
ncbi:hypothetical protein [Canibacter zhoujuaniae]|uniref:hypothetical protein n=1 Tax=Canibacter zhoujuaniae TaxID=2708343 RepID=UPI0014206D49|nr:hypothetical protein [Canibacter zhoujuaniae]